MAEELPEPEIEAAEERPAPHRHEVMDDDALLAHLQDQHGLDTPEHLSRSTLEGVHDRLHDETDATDL
ncbi:MAG TPA: hypothetical protein VFS16_16220 [Acidimicrobiia bacterium]|nr:hypothetical protein [Acidimicrobiia bacterium]